MKISFQNAYYIKLGEAGKWEDSSIAEGIARIGWRRIKLPIINAHDWEKIVLQEIEEDFHGKKGPATADTNALKHFVESMPNDVWITFYKSHLWWCQLAEGKVQEDSTSRYRKTKHGWSKYDVERNDLLTELIPGSISKLQGFRGTICRVRETNDLQRLINHEFSIEYNLIKLSREHLIEEVESGIKRLHWRDFELLIDLIFSQSGWRRISFVGTAKEFSDIDLEDPITKDLYQVQIKSKASEQDFKNYAAAFSEGKYRRLFFVVHSPDKKFLNMKSHDNPKVEIIFGRRIAEMVVDLGLLGWLMKKIH